MSARRTFSLASTTDTVSLQWETRFETETRVEK